MKTSEVRLRDPFVLVDQGTYYLYGTRGKAGNNQVGFDCYMGHDLENWEGPFDVFEPDEDFWATKEFWAPEVHHYEGSYYMFASFKADGVCRGTQILKANSPKGPFKIHSDGPITPRDWECLDGTLYISKNGTPYMVFCHEWVQIKDGTICAVELSKDLKSPVGEPRTLFYATEGGNWICPPSNGGIGDYVTDGPFLHRLEDDTLIMMWSSFGKDGYIQAIAESDNGEITGNWKTREKLLFEKDGGHGMLFVGLDEKLYLTLHSPNITPREAPKFIEISEKDL
ncbi:MAG: glycoside hydrolase family 43 protein [Eubacteriales bacterium]